MSHPVWGAWIETMVWLVAPLPSKKSHPVWGAWIETYISSMYALLPTSHPVWGAWIETPFMVYPIVIN